MFGSWFGDLGATRARKAAKRRALSKKAGRKSARIPQTRKVPPRKYPRRTAPATTPTFSPAPVTPPPEFMREPRYEPEEEGGWLTYSPFTTSPTPPPETVPGKTVTIGKPTPHTQTVCGCSVVRLKNKREAIKCPGGPTGKGMFRFAKESDIERAKAADNICTHVPIFGVRRGPLSPEERARRAAKQAYAFKTSRGEVIVFKRKPRMRTLKRHVALWYHLQDKMARARGAKLRYLPSFGDVYGDINDAYGDWGW